MKYSRFFYTFLLFLALIFPLNHGLSSDEQVIEDHQFESDVGTAVFSLLKTLPEIWKLKKEARKLSETLPDYDGEVEVPDSDIIYEWLTELCSTPHRRPGTPEGIRAEGWVANKFREIGLQDIKLDPVSIRVWEAQQWSLTIEGQNIPSFFVLNTEFTPKSGISAPMVYVGVGDQKDFKKTDVKGKIVVAEVPFPILPTGLLLRGIGSSYVVSNPDGSFKLSSWQYLNFVRPNFVGQSTLETAPSTDVYWNAVKNGAAGICLILKNQPSRYNTHYGPYDGIMKPMPGLWIGKYEGEKLRKYAKQEKEATLKLTGSNKPGEMKNVWGILPGMSDDVILVTSHHDSPFKGASEDGAGTVQVLAQAWAWSRVPKEKRDKTMVFVVDGGHFYGSKGAFQFAREHKDIMDRTRILLTLEHLAAKDVEEKDGEYEPNGDPALTVMFTSHDPTVVAAVMKAFDKKPPKRTASISSTFFGEAPASDAAGYVLEAGVPVISWIGCPYYLLDSGDTLDKIEKSELAPIAETVTEIVKVFMAID
ncbi:MAG: M28 family peptidase [Deltaproteobacteria bacterium]|nr:M28 family peptidase [Deltaproteobacteria bacterium]